MKMRGQLVAHLFALDFVGGGESDQPLAMASNAKAMAGAKRRCPSLRGNEYQINFGEHAMQSRSHVALRALVLLLSAQFRLCRSRRRSVSCR